MLLLLVREQVATEEVILQVVAITEAGVAIMEAVTVGVMGEAKVLLLSEAAATAQVLLINALNASTQDSKT